MEDMKGSQSWDMHQNADGPVQARPKASSFGNAVRGLDCEENSLRFVSLGLEFTDGNKASTDL